MLWLLALIPAAIVIFLAVIILRAVAFKPLAQPVINEAEEDFDREKTVSNLRTLVRFKTVSYRDSSLEDNAEFEAFIAELPKLYPNVFSVCEFNKLLQARELRRNAP